MARPMSTTAHAVLGMLAVRPMTPYELTQQMRRSLDYCWPTSERSLYEQPERLVAAGLAEVSDPGDEGGRREYRITPEGRAALRDWLATPTGTPRFQNEPLLRVLLADQGTIEDLHGVTAALREHVVERRRNGLEQMEPYLDGEGLFQDRAHIVVLVADLVGRLLDVIEDWTDEVDSVTADWDSTADVGMTDDVRRVLDRMVADARERRDRPSAEPRRSDRPASPGRLGDAGFSRK